MCGLICVMGAGELLWELCLSGCVHHCLLLMGSPCSSLHARMFRKTSHSPPRTVPSPKGRLLLPQLHSQSQLQAVKQRRLSQIRVSSTGSVSSPTTHSTFLALAQ